LSSVSTADGRKQEVVGQISIPLQFKGREENLDLHLISSLLLHFWLIFRFWPGKGVYSIPLN